MLSSWPPRPTSTSTTSASTIAASAAIAATPTRPTGGYVLWWATVVDAANTGQHRQHTALVMLKDRKTKVVDLTTRNSELSLCFIFYLFSMTVKSFQPLDL
jgi:hypothetical protein